MRILTQLLVHAVLLSLSFAAQASPTSDLARMRGGKSAYRIATDETLDTILAATIPELAAFDEDPRHPPSIDLFTNLVGLTDYYFAQWEQRRDPLDENRRDLALERSREMYGTHVNRHCPLKFAVADALGPDAGCDAAVHDAARPHWLARVCAQRAWLVLRRLSRMRQGSLLLNTPFREAYLAYTRHGEHFGFLSELWGLREGRRKYEFIERLAESAIPDWEWGKIRQNPSAAQGYLMTADLTLTTAREFFAGGRCDNVEKLVWDMTHEIAEARSFGCSRRNIREMYSRHQSALQGQDSCDVPGQGALTLGELVASALRNRIEEASSKRGVDLRGFLAHEEVTDPPRREETETPGIRETVRVEATAPTLNYELYVYREQDLLRREGLGEETLVATMALAQEGKLLLQGMLRGIVRPSRYERILQLFADRPGGGGEPGRVAYAGRSLRLPDPVQPLVAESLASEGTRCAADQGRHMREWGQRMLLIPALESELQQSRASDRIAQELRVPDCAELYVDLGDAWTRSARERSREALSSLIEALDSTAHAVYSYLQAIGRYEDLSSTTPHAAGISARSPSAAHLAMGQSAFNMVALVTQAEDAMDRFALIGEQDVASHLGGGPAAEIAARRLESYRSHVEEILDLSEQAFLTVRQRGRGVPGDAWNRRYLDFVESLAGLIRVRQQRGNLPHEIVDSGHAALREARRTSRALAASTPANGEQFFMRGVVYADRLGLVDPAVKDLCAAAPRLLLAGDPSSARRARQRALELGSDCER